MSSTTFSGPVTSTAGFVGVTTGNVTTALISALDATSAATVANTTGIITVTGGITFADAKNVAVNATTGTIIATATTQKLGFFAAAPVVQQATTGTSAGFTAGGGTAATSTSTFTGNSGTKAYTVSDVVLALKNLGLLAAS